MTDCDLVALEPAAILEDLAAVRIDCDRLAERVSNLEDRLRACQQILEFLTETGTGTISGPVMVLIEVSDAALVPTPVGARDFDAVPGRGAERRD